MFCRILFLLVTFACYSIEKWTVNIKIKKPTGKPQGGYIFEEQFEIGPVGKKTVVHAKAKWLNTVSKENLEEDQDELAVRRMQNIFRKTSSIQEFHLIYSTYMRDWPVKIAGPQTHPFYTTPSPNIILFRAELLFVLKFTMIALVVFNWLLIVIIFGEDVFLDCQLHIAAVHINFQPLDLVGYIAD